MSIKTFKNYTYDDLILSGMRIGINVNISNDVIFHNPSNIIIGDNVRIDSQCILIAGKNTEIKLGNNIHISAGTFFYANSGNIVLEDYTTISGRCTLYTANDDYTEGYMTNPSVNEEFRKVTVGDILIKRHVIIGCNSVVLPNVTLEYATSAGAYSLIKNSTQPFELVRGIPAKKFGYRKNKYLCR